MATGFGIIGCGMIANFHAKAIASLKNAKLVACYDTFPSAADRLAASTGCKAYHDLDEMLADPAVEVVTIGTPSGAHLDPAVKAARAGKHVIVEKPLEITLKKCDQIISECEKAGVVLGSIFPSRFHDSSVQMKKAIDANRFGKLTMGDAYVKWFRSQGYYDSGAWRGTWELDGGGALMNQAIHSVDLLSWFMGPVVEIRAQWGLVDHQNIEVEDTVVATLKFASGALGVIEASTATFPGSLKRVEIAGSAGSATLEEEDLIRWQFAKPRASDAKVIEAMNSKKSTGGGAADPAAIGFHGHAKLFADVLKAIKNGTKPSIDGYEGRKATEIILGVYQAAESGKPVTLPLVKDPALKARKNKTVSL